MTNTSLQQKESWRLPELPYSAIKAETAKLPESLREKAQEIADNLAAKIRAGAYKEEVVWRFFAAKLRAFRQPFSSLPVQPHSDVTMGDEDFKNLWRDLVLPIYEKYGISEVRMFAQFRQTQADLRKVRSTFH